MMLTKENPPILMKQFNAYSVQNRQHAVKKINEAALLLALKEIEKSIEEIEKYLLTIIWELSKDTPTE